MTSKHWNTATGLFLGSFSLIALIWWIPGDIESGILIQERYSVHIGDAMLPTGLALILLVLSGALIVQSLFRRRSGPAPSDEAGMLDASGAINLLIMTGIVGASVALMVWTGPVLVDALNGMGVTDKSYRQLSDTAPFKYSGFALGGFVMVFGLTSWVQGRTSWRAALTASGMVVFLIVLYDVPFDGLLLPPNGSH